MQTHRSAGWKRGVWSLSPLPFFAIFYLTSSILAGDFYSTPIIVTFLVTILYALLTLKGKSLQQRTQILTEGAADHNIMLMIWIFILAGAFASGAKYIGAIDATVNLTLNLLPGNFILAGLFLASCFLSLSMGTSVGTIAALAPIAAGLSTHTSLPTAFLVGIVVGGAYFGDNLSFISDTTIMATRTQGCNMRDKFRTNLLIVLPAALIVLGIYMVLGHGLQVEMPQNDTAPQLVLPYLIVLLLAILGVNVMVVLLLGIGATLALALSQGLPLTEWMKALSDGVLNLGELIVVTLMAGGLMTILRSNGGLDYITNHLFGRVKTRRKGEASIGALVFMANLCTANNTIAILTVGSIAREIALKCHIDPRKSASLLDTFSCLAQSLIPYGAQLLIASNLSGVGSVEIIPYLVYPCFLALFAAVSILLGFPRMRTRA